MKRSLIAIAIAFALALTAASPAFAATGAGSAGEEFGRHHAGMAQEMGGFTGAENPGVHHQGFKNWPGV